MATKHLTKAKKDIIRQVRERWENTVFNGTPNIQKAKECLIAGYKNGLGSFKTYESFRPPVFHEVHSPIAFGIAHAITRGRLSKTRTRQLCLELDIDYRQFANIKRDKGLRWRDTSPRWYQHLPSEFSRTWLRAIDENYRTLEENAAESRLNQIRRWRWGNTPEVSVDMRVNHLSYFGQIARSLFADSAARQVHKGSREELNEQLSKFQSVILMGAASTEKTMGSLCNAYEDGIFDFRLRSQANADATASETPFLRRGLNVEDAEILCRLIGITDLQYTWEYELFHHLTAFAAFEDSCIILAQRPSLKLDDENNLHSDDSPAVSWSDGAKLWFNHGHFLNECGQLIVTNPAGLSTNKILSIENEETRRVAIDNFGWEKFVAEAGCPLLDQRENDVDNTIEILFGAPPSDQNWRRTNKIVLFCRSTGRRYFLSVPREITTCEQAQKWMSAANVTAVDVMDRHKLQTGNFAYAAHDVRLVGAS